MHASKTLGVGLLMQILHDAEIDPACLRNPDDALQFPL